MRLCTVRKEDGGGVEGNRLGIKRSGLLVLGRCAKQQAQWAIMHNWKTYLKTMSPSGIKMLTITIVTTTPTTTRRLNYSPSRGWKGQMDAYIQNIVISLPCSAALPSSLSLVAWSMVACEGLWFSPVVTSKDSILKKKKEHPKHASQQKLMGLEEILCRN